jgi:hypothetical protein
MTKGKRQIGHLQFHLDQPTEYSFAELHTWVIWQFPRTDGQGMLGAVHPPIAQHGWLPALVHPYKERVIIHAHHPQTYPTPEAAADAL